MTMSQPAFVYVPVIKQSWDSHVTNSVSLSFMARLWNVYTHAHMELKGLKYSMEPRNER